MATPIKDSASTATEATPAGQPAGSRAAPKRRKTAPMRRVSARVADRHDPRPIIFNYGANLTRLEREKAKERLAMIGVAVVAVLCVLLLAWGWIDQNVIIPAQPVATVNGTDIRQDAYNHMQKWQQVQLTARINQLQQEINSVSASKNSTGLVQYLSQQLTQLQNQQQTLPSDTLTNMEETVALKQGAQTLFGIQATPAQLDTETATVVKQLGGSSAYKNVLSSTGLSVADFRQWIVEPSVLTPKVTDQLGKSISPYGPLEVHARHILVKAADKALAQRLMTRLEHGASWTALAKKYSIDPGSKDKGGDLGTFQQGQMVAPFDQAVFSMKRGEIRLVKSTFGWHIVQDLSKPIAHKLTTQELATKKSDAFNTWIQKQVTSAHISPASAIPNFGTSGSLPGAVPGQ
jgi:parvulin-like peptidyl-prolyl isomerase